jgi:DNA recombination protein RmuC
MMPIVTLALLVIVLALLLALFVKTSKATLPLLDSRLDAFEKAQERTERAVREEVAHSRDELGKAARDQRQELTEAFKVFGDSFAQRMTDVARVQKTQLDAQFEAFENHLVSFAQVSSEKLDGVRVESATGARQLREEVVTTLKSISETMITTIKDLAVAEKAQLETFAGQIASLTKTSGDKLDAMRATVEVELRRMHDDNTKQLEQMRQTVDEKLQGTLEKRLGESFKLVSERLEQVHKGLGEMQTLATGVGDLKKVLTNVKVRGVWGEVQLGSLLEQVLSPDQFARNVTTRDAGERVEFAVKLPGQGTDKDETIWLPIDAKFPVEDYQRLIEAQERADVEGVESAGKHLENRVKSCARDISEKYLNPPKTTDFGILFLPIEGLFAEVIRRTGLVETIQRECRVIIAGPTTLWSILNSLQMGFRTLAIEKRSSEVWNLLAAVKTEWTKYGEILEAVERKLHQASDTIEKAKVRTKAIGRKLRDVQELPAADIAALLPKNEVESIENGDTEGDVEDGETPWWKVP